MIACITNTENIMPQNQVFNRSNPHNKPYHNHHQYLLGVIGVVLATMILGGCDKTENVVPEAVHNEVESLDVFAGCYTVSYGEPAQIKVSKQADGWVMQMKEPARNKRIWDEPELLEEIDKRQIGKYFSIDKQHVTAMIGRPDRVMVLAHVTDAYANIDPLLDSQYLVFIYQGANTIYKVPCDNINTDIKANPHANIVIEQVTPNATDTADAADNKIPDSLDSKEDNSQ